jgi:hypothetical protein
MSLAAALLLPLTAVQGAGETVQMKGILDPSVAGGVCDWGQTHGLTDPCTGEFAYVWSWTTAYDCQYVLVQGRDSTPEYCPLLIAMDFAVPAFPPCLIQIRDLILKPVTGGHRLDWADFACAGSYDVIRGSVSGLSAENAGAVICLANDVLLSRVDDLTGDAPSSGQAFFYLVRPNDAFSSYGHSSSASPRFPATGDCPD